MPETLTQMAISPPNNGCGVAIASDSPDDIRDIGDRIARLTIKESTELAAYLASKGIK